MEKTKKNKDNIHINIWIKQERNKDNIINGNG